MATGDWMKELMQLLHEIVKRLEKLEQEMEKLKCDGLK